MLNTKEAARKLGISETRIRTLLNNGQLEGVKIGRTWLVSEESIEARRKSNVKAGRPRKTLERSSSPSENPRNAQKPPLAHILYLECKQALSGGFRSETLKQAQSAEEERFYVTVANFFLQEKQRELVEQGVF